MDWVAILGAIGGLSGLIIFLITRHDEKKKVTSFTAEEKKAIFDFMKKAEQDSCRLQLLNMMQHQPTNKDTILMLAEHYFEDLGGNWYMSSEFSRWTKEQKVDTKLVREIKSRKE